MSRSFATEFTGVVLFVLIFVAPLTARAEALEAVVRQTLQDSPDVRQVAANRRATDQQLQQSYAGYLPRVDFNGAYGYENSDNPTTRGLGEDDVSLTRRELGITARQMLYDGNAVSNDVEFQRSRVRSAAFRVGETSESTALQTVEVYLEVLRRQEILDLAQQNVALHRNILEQIRARAQGGAGNTADVTQAEARLALAQSSLVGAKGRLLTARDNYQRIVGAPPAELLEPTPPTNQLPASVDDALDRAREQHPTLMAAMGELAAAQAQRQGSRAAFLPSLDLELGTTNNHNLDGVSGTNQDLTALVRMRYNLFRGGADRARRQETAERVIAAQQGLDRASREVDEGVQIAWDSLDTARQRLEFLTAHRDASERVLDAYRKQFGIGQRTLLDVLDSENELFNARTARVTGRYTVTLSIYRLIGSTGGLLSALDIAPPADSVPRAADLQLAW